MYSLERYQSGLEGVVGQVYSFRYARCTARVDYSARAILIYRFGRTYKRVVRRNDVRIGGETVAAACRRNLQRRSVRDRFQRVRYYRYGCGRAAKYHVRFRFVDKRRQRF